MPRTIAIGDIHGYTAALDAIVALVAPAAEDAIVLMGDYVDRGPDSRGTIERVIELGCRCRTIPLLGNHDHLFLEVCQGRSDLLADWLAFGGAQTVASYGRVPADVPPAHIDFLAACPRYFETDGHFFVHANYDAKAPISAQPAVLLLWQSLRERLPGPHVSGKMAIVGHTAQKNGEVFDLGYLKCIDTYLYGGGWLTALDVDTGRFWQVDQSGRPREKP
jgi:serine/threonine protein phosphatase 1